MDWRSEEIVDDGDYVLIEANNPMVAIGTNDFPWFPRRRRAMNPTSVSAYSIATTSEPGTSGSGTSGSETSESTSVSELGMSLLNIRIETLKPEICGVSLVVFNSADTLLDGRP